MTDLAVLTKEATMEQLRTPEIPGRDVPDELPDEKPDEGSEGTGVGEQQPQGDGVGAGSTPPPTPSGGNNPN